MIERDDTATDNTLCSQPIHCSLWSTCSMTHLETHRLLKTIHHRLDPRLLILLCREPERVNQWHTCHTGWVGTCDSVCPEPSNHRRLTASVLLGQMHFWVKMTDAFPRFVPHPIAIVADIFGQPLGAFPLLMQILLSRFGIHGRASRELWRNLDQRLVNQYGHWVE